MTGGRPWWQAVPIGIGVGVAAGFLALAILGIPVYGVANVIDPSSGLDRPGPRTLIHVLVIPGAILVGLASMVWAVRWWRRGGALPD